MRLLLLCLASACASAASAGDAYRDLGRHELAVGYYAAALRADPKDEEIRAALLRGMDAALRTVGAEYEDDNGKGDARGALGAALRKEELLNQARALKLTELSSMTAKPEVERAFAAAAKASVAAVDEAASKGGDVNAVSAQLRGALALDPNNPELASRYERLRQANLRAMVPRLECDAANPALCDAVQAQLVGALLALNPERLAMATPSSQTMNTELALKVIVRTSERPWAVQKRDRVTAQIPKLDKFREPVVQNGKKVMETVQATYTLHAASSIAEITVRAAVRDLGPSRAALYERSVTKNSTDERRYIDWEGDERALGDLIKIGTDQSAPATPENVARRLIEAVAGELARDILARLEGNVS